MFNQPRQPASNRRFARSLRQVEPSSPSGRSNSAVNFLIKQLNECWSNDSVGKSKYTPNYREGIQSSIASIRLLPRQWVDLEGRQLPKQSDSFPMNGIVYDVCLSLQIRKEVVGLSHIVKNITQTLDPIFVGFRPLGRSDSTHLTEVDIDWEVLSRIEWHGERKLWGMVQLEVSILIA